MTSPAHVPILAWLRACDRPESTPAASAAPRPLVGLGISFASSTALPAELADGVSVVNPPNTSSTRASRLLNASDYPCFSPFRGFQDLSPDCNDDPSLLSENDRSSIARPTFSLSGLDNSFLSSSIGTDSCVLDTSSELPLSTPITEASSFHFLDDQKHTEIFAPQPQPQAASRSKPALDRKAIVSRQS